MLVPRSHAGRTVGRTKRGKEAEEESMGSMGRAEEEEARERWRALQCWACTGADRRASRRSEERVLARET